MTKVKTMMEMTLIKMMILMIWIKTMTLKISVYIGDTVTPS